jgi:hypothetical protein
MSSKSVDGTTGESGISTIVLGIGTNVGDELQGHVNTNHIPLIDSTTILISI